MGMLSTRRNGTALTRRAWLESMACLGATAAVSAPFPNAFGAAEAPADARDLGSRRELFIDHFLIERLTGTELKLHEPQLAPAMTEPADHLEYGTVIKEGE